jgi:hypothetical protein
LDEALSKRGREAWSIGRDFPPRLNLRREIFRAIKGTNTFIFGWPNSVISKLCRDEIAHAIRTEQAHDPIVAAT